MKTKLMIAALACALFGANPAALAQGSHLSSTPSNVSGAVVLGSLLVVAVGGSVVAQSVDTVADGTVVVLRNVADGSTATVKLSGDGARGFSKLVGQTVTVTATASGHVLIAAGKVIAFIPTEIGKGLLHHSQNGAKG
ncbi:hypothetical protein HF313_25390 [Massilia atriviolacea]|uniref:DUF5666 domain-containing protein n=1 Tax=Massilia atriviolacea TaxID=2495579 RepID=A0A430HN47_9BURK|nr:hypothetical protein [Massilia atriviolacea]RSZ58987.1 hypothetical protein EJB06_11685 [Massilia atriviolacea]